MTRVTCRFRPRLLGARFSIHEPSCVGTEVATKPISQAQNGKGISVDTLTRQGGLFEPEEDPPKGPSANLRPLELKMGLWDAWMGNFWPEKKWEIIKWK